MLEKIVSGTGHRPQKLGGYSQQAHRVLIDIAKDWLIANRPEEVIVGMALGWDTALAEAALELNIPLTAAVPFKGQELKWSVDTQKLYHEILAKAKRVVIVSEGGYSADKMDIRNRWMVDNSNTILAMHDGSAGGTNNCVKYAKKKDKPIINLYNIWLQARA